MPKVTIDEKEYDTEEMSQQALANLQAIQFCDNDLARLQMNGAALQTAKAAYIRALKTELEQGEAQDDEASIDLPDDLVFD